MSRPKPIAGHRTLSGACAALARDGLTSAEIGARLGIEVSKASALTAYRLGRDGINRRPSAAKGRTVVVDVDILAALQPHAARRSISVNQLVRDLLVAIADDGLVDGVLDDAADLPPQPQQVPA